LPFLPWLFAICRHLLIDFTRRRRPLPVEASELVVISPEEGNEWGAILGGLNREQRTLLELRFEQGLSFEELAVRYGIASAALRKRVSRLIRRLREEVSFHGR
jgi:RNA polymerase sigma factor (sigma-70 family)